MPQRCTVGHSSARAEIDRALVTRELSFPAAARRFRLSQSSLYRHYCEHLPGALVKAREAAAVASSDRLLTELQRCLERVNLLFDACDRWLRDPEDPSRYEVGARAEDVSVTYFEAGSNGQPVRRKARLSALLGRLDEMPTFLFTDVVEIKCADPRELVLKTAERLEGHLSLLAKLEGRLQEVSIDAVRSKLARTITLIRTALAPTTAEPLLEEMRVIWEAR